MWKLARGPATSQVESLGAIRPCFAQDDNILGVRPAPLKMTTNLRRRRAHSYHCARLPGDAKDLRCLRDGKAQGFKTRGSNTASGVRRVFHRHDVLLLAQGPSGNRFAQRSAEKSPRCTLDQEASAGNGCTFAPLITSHSMIATSPRRAGKALRKATSLCCGDTKPVKLRTT